MTWRASSQELSKVQTLELLGIKAVKAVKASHRHDHTNMFRLKLVAVVVFGVMRFANRAHPREKYCHTCGVAFI